MSTVAILLRWMHIVPAVVAGGAVIFSWLALLPALAELQAPDRLRVKEAIDRRWRIVVMVCVTLLLLSGIANFVLYQAPAHTGQPLYHALFGIKFLAALGVFFLASALSGRSPGLAPMRANARFWVGVSATLVVLIVAISGVLRSLPRST